MYWGIGRNRKISKKLGSPETAPEPSWAKRLEEVGRSLDAYGALLQNIAVVVALERVMVSAHGWRTSLYHSGRTLLTLVIDRGRTMPLDRWASSAGLPEPSSSAYDTSSMTRQHGTAGTPDLLSSARRLRAVGVLLDRESRVLRDILVLEVGEGFIAQGLPQAIGEGGREGPSVSFEYTAADLAAVMAKE